MFAQRRYPSHLHSPIVLVRQNLVDLWRNLLTVAGDDDGRHRHGDMLRPDPWITILFERRTKVEVQELVLRVVNFIEAHGYDEQVLLREIGSPS